MSLAGRIGRAIFLGQAGRLVEASAMFLLSLLLARVLGPAGYGLYALGIGVAGVCGLLSLFGLGPETLGKFVPEIAADAEQHQVISLLRSLLRIKTLAILTVACGVFALRNVIAARLHAPLVALSFAAILLIFAARSVLDLLTFFFSSLLDLRRVVVAKTFAGLIPPALLFVLFVLHHGSVSAAWLSIATGYLVGIAILGYPFLYLQSSLLDKPRFPLRRIIAFGVFAWATNIFIYILSDSTDVLLLGLLITDRAAIGRYAACARIVFSLTSLLLGWTSLVGIASFSESYQRAGLPGLTRTLESVWKFGVFCLVPCLIFIFRFARTIVTILFSVAYVPAATSVQILAGLLACGAFCGFSIHGGILYVLNKERFACGIVGSTAAFNVVSEIVLVRHLGVEGAAWATGGSFILLAAWCWAGSARYVQLRAPIEFFSKIGLAAGVGLLVTSWLQPASALQVMGAAALYIFGFLVALMLFKPLTKVDSLSLGRINSALGGYADRFFTAAYASPQSGNR